MIDTAALRKKWPDHTSSTNEQCAGCALHAALDEIDRLRAEKHTSSVLIGSPQEMVRSGRLLVVEPEEDWPSCVTRPAGCGRELLTALQQHEKGLCRCGTDTP